MKIDIKAILPKLKKYLTKIYVHVSFIAIIIILIMYLFTVWRINTLGTAEPTQESLDTALKSTNIPKVNKSAIQQIQSLEQSSTQIHSLFEQARNNPFQE